MTADSGKMLCRAHHCMIVSCRAHGCIFLSFLLKRQKITTVGSEQPENITFHGKRQKKSAMGRSVPKRWAQVDFTAPDPMLCALAVALLQGLCTSVVLYFVDSTSR